MNSQMNQSLILWADDDPDDIAMMRDVLESMNTHHSIVEVDNGKKVLDYLQHKSPLQLPCLIVLDMNMPVLSGRETLVLLKQDPFLQHIPVVVFTTSNSSLDKVFCERYGAEMITKPVSYTALQDIIQKLLQFCEMPAEIKPAS
jgi:CheY-like chemotaxis protein